MSRTNKDMPRKVLANRGALGWQWCERPLWFCGLANGYRYPWHHGICSCGGHTPGKDMRREYWGRVRARTRRLLRDEIQPEPTATRGSLKWAAQC